MNEIICKKSIPYLLMIVFGLMGYFVNHILSPVTLAGTVAAADDQSIQWDRYLETVKD